MSQLPPPPPPPPPPPGGAPPWPGGGHGSADGDAGHDPREIGEEPTTSPIPLWAGLTVAGLFVLPIVVFGLIGLMMDAGNGDTSALSAGELTFALAFTIVVQLALFAVAVVPLLAKGWFGRALWGSTRPVTIAIGLAVGVVGTIAVYVIMAILAMIVMPEDPVEQQILQDALRGGAPMVLAIVVAVVIAPVTEEIVFRGALFRSLRGRMGVWPAAIVSGIVFALIHVEVVTSQPLALTGLFLLGVAFAIALHRTGSLIVPIVAHAVFNASSIGLAILADRLDVASMSLVPLPVLGLG